MKKAFVLLFGLAVAGQALAAATVICANQPQAHSGVVVNGGANFVKQDFLPKCSANVDAKYDQTTIGFAVAAASTKGKQIFTGNTGGGAVSGSATCTLPCTATQLDTPLGTALAQAT